MTRDEILNMPAGREMDTIILRDILKYKPVYVQEGALFGTVGELGCWYNESGMFVPLGASPSNDISIAWEVVEKMVRFSITIESFPKGVLCRFFGAGQTTAGDAVGWADTAPLAICRAALLAVEAAQC